MKKILLILLAIGFGVSGYSQKVKEKDVIGTWKLIINAQNELEKEAAGADTMLEEVFIKSISGFVDSILDEINIYFEFRQNNDLKLIVKANDENETKYGTWFINKRGYLEIKNIDNDDEGLKIETDENEWKLIDDIMVSDEDDRNVYLTRVD